MEKTKKYDAIMEALESMDNDDLVDINNEYCDKNNYSDDRIYRMYELDELFGDMRVTEFLEKLTDEFRVSDDYFKYGIYGLESTDLPSDWMDISDIADYIESHDDSLRNNEIQEILDEFEDDEEEPEE